jgi:hypothetical protein
MNIPTPEIVNTILSTYRATAFMRTHPPNECVVHPWDYAIINDYWKRSYSLEYGGIPCDVGGIRGMKLIQDTTCEIGTAKLRHVTTTRQVIS